MVSPTRSNRDRSFSPIGHDLIRSSSPVPSIASVSSGAPTVVETLKPKRHAQNPTIHRSRRVIGNDSFQLPPDPVAQQVSSPRRHQDESYESVICPVCNHEMASVTQLDRHLEEAHNDMGQNMQSKFMKYLTKAKNFTPVQALNQTLAYADLSDLSFAMPMGPNIGPDGLASFSSSPSHGAGFAGPQHSGNGSGVTFVGHHNLAPSAGGRATPVLQASHVTAAVPQKPRLTEDLITRAHWQRETGNDVCSEYKCRRLLTTKTGKGNCRSCGRLFCDEHLGCQMKLNKRAKWDPVHGVWARVCFSCFESRPGFNDASGMVEDITSSFKETRRKTVTKAHLEANLLEKRLVKLIKLLLDTNDPSVVDRSKGIQSVNLNGKPTEVALGAAGVAATMATGYFKQIRNYRKPPEQAVVAWEDDKDVKECSYCNQTFSFSLRKHHCRLCGKVVCSSPDTSCSSKILLDNELLSSYLPEKVDDSISVNIRVCKDCRSVVFGMREFAKDVARRPKFVEVYANMVEFKRGIEMLLPRFQKLLDNFNDPNKPPSHEFMTEASKVRKRLLYSFQEFDTAAKQIWKMPTKSAQQAKLQNNIHISAMTVLQMYMLPLKSLPHALKHSQ
ncbi:FYVE zinc finger-domain-containing protein [Lipomyces arxii]|uniref:FYVE zinc finger-domain-containing protein n=1 Tax=Lipomyces arxii TaxID=56418 RepID=UPI0034CD05C9